MSAVPRTSADITAWSREFLAGLLDLPLADIDAGAKFTELGLDSGKSAQFVLALEDRLGIELEPEIVEDYPTITALVQHLCGDS